MTSVKLTGQSVFYYPIRWAGILLLAALAWFISGCFLESDGETATDSETEKTKIEVIRNSDSGPIIVAFTAFPGRSEAPRDGVETAIVRSIGRMPCSAATVYWPERSLSLSWIREQCEKRRRGGQEPRLILAGHGLGATEASEVAKEIMFKDRDAVIVLLLTVDAVKTSKIGSAAGATGNVVTRRIPGVNHSFTAYDASPQPDGKQLLAHINYYQTRSVYYHGAAMPGAENHHLDDWTGLLNHGNVDDFALTFLIADLRGILGKERQ